MNDDFYYKRRPALALKGMERLSLEEAGAYSKFLDLMYLEGRALGGHEPDDERWFANHLNCTTRKWRAVRDALIAKGRIRLGDDGLLHDDVAEEEIEKRGAERETNRANGAAGGRKRAENAVKHLRNINETQTKPERNFREPDEELNENNDGPQAGLGNGFKQLQLELDSSRAATHTHAREAPPVVWTQRLAELRVALGEKLNRTSGGLETWAPLKALTEPRTGEACDWDDDVVPAIHAVAATAFNAGRPLFSWSHPAIAEHAVRNRDRRLAGLPEPITESLTHDHSHRASGPRRRSYADEQRAASEASLESWGRVLAAVGAE